EGVKRRRTDRTGIYGVEIEREIDARSRRMAGRYKILYLFVNGNVVNCNLRYNFEFSISLKCR
ncbi:MAG: hypothetical protein RSD28_05870, partial [Lachnospiraceae bacterium]